MSIVNDAGSVPLLARRRANTLVRYLYGPLLLLADALAIHASSIAAGMAYHLWSYGDPGAPINYIDSAFLVSVLFCGATLTRGGYKISEALGLSALARHTANDWLMTGLLSLSIAFLAKVSDHYSRGAVVSFFTLGFVVVLGIRLATAARVKAGVRAGQIAARRVLLIGREADVVKFVRRYQPSLTGLQVVGTSFLDRSAIDMDNKSQGRLAVNLRRAVSTARALRPDDVYICVPWAETEVIYACIDALMNIPSAIHLAPERILDRFDSVSIGKIGGVASLELTRLALNTAEILLKRGFDIIASICGLIVLSPLFLVVAILIKLDSPGPVFFMQRRYGFNQHPFRIFKFRSMRVLDDGHDVRQATKNDARITKLGAFLRRSNIDELPRLLNVLLGHMSIVGPRPHAVAHNRAFEQRISLYARRHNVKPGITGWAQVNGLRGETDTDEKMRARVEHDLFYIDNWSFWLDLRICLLTILSPKAFRNAY